MTTTLTLAKTALLLAATLTVSGFAQAKMPTNIGTMDAPAPEGMPRNIGVVALPTDSGGRSAPAGMPRNIGVV